MSSPSIERYRELPRCHVLRWPEGEAWLVVKVSGAQWHLYLPDRQGRLLAHLSLSMSNHVQGWVARVGWHFCAGGMQHCSYLGDEPEPHHPTHAEAVHRALARVREWDQAESLAGYLSASWADMAHPTALKFVKAAIDKQKQERERREKS